MMFILLLAMVVGGAVSLPQQRPDYDYLYEDFVGTPDFQQPIPQAPLLEGRPRSRAQAAPAPQRAAPAPQRAAPRNSAAASRLTDPDVSTTTYIPILKDERRTDPITGAFIYDYMGADGSGKYEIRFINGTVVGNYTFINDVGERETRSYSAGTKPVHVGADGSLIDETTDPTYVDLSNYELYRHLEVPYVHEVGPSDPDERGQISRPRVAQQDRAPRPQARPQPVQQPRQSAPIPIDHGDPARFAPQQQQQQQQQQAAAPRRSQNPSRVSRTRVRVAGEPAGQPRPRVVFDPRAVDGSSPDHLLDSIINQFQ